MASPQIDDVQLSSLAAEGLSQNAIAKRLGLPRSTVRDRLKKLDLASVPDTTPAVSTQGIPYVYNDMLITMINDLQELVAWWQERKATIQQASDTTRETERMTFHVEHRWIEAIRRQADLDHLSITQVVNEAFRRYFEGK
jgi:DNA-binding Lrp family transcriptional regulator